MIWMPLIAAAMGQMQKSRDEARNREQVAAQMTADAGATLMGGGNSYRAPPPPEKNGDYSALFSMFNDKDKSDKDFAFKSANDQRTSDAKTSAAGLSDPWSPSADKQKDELEKSWNLGG